MADAAEVGVLELAEEEPVRAVRNAAERIRRLVKRCADEGVAQQVVQETQLIERALGALTQ